MYGILGREITKYTVIYDVYVRFWPTQTIRRGTPFDIYILTWYSLFFHIDVVQAFGTPQAVRVYMNLKFIGIYIYRYASFSLTLRLERQKRRSVTSTAAVNFIQLVFTHSV
jgi:hypothetical protein